MRRQTLNLIVPTLVLALALSIVTVLPVTGQDTGIIIDKLNQLHTKLEGEKPVLQNKVNAVIHQIEAGAFSGAINKLQNDVKKSIIAWVEDPEELIQLVDEIIDLIKGIVPPEPPTPDFEIDAQPDQLKVVQGESNTTEITITSTANFNQEVMLRATTTASDTALTLDPNSLTPPINASATSTLQVEAAQSATLGLFKITVTGTSGALEHHVTISLRIIEAVEPPPAKDFAIAASPSELTIQQGKSNTSIISVTSVNSFHKQVDLAITSDIIAGIDTTLNPTMLIPPPDESAISILIVNVASTASLGAFNITVTGESNSLQHSVNITLTITEPPVQPTPDFSLNAFPESLIIEQGDTATSTIISTSLRGFSGPVALSVAPESISGITINLDPTQVTLSPNGFATSTLQVEVDKDAEPDEYEIIITGSSGSLQHSVSISLTIILERKPPRVASVLRLPERAPAYNETVKVLASVFDLESGIKDVILGYSTEGTQQNLTMALSAGVYQATIPAYPFNAAVDYRIYALDNAGNWIASMPYSYAVVDPYPPVIDLPTWLPQEPGANEAIDVNVTVSEPPEASGVHMVVLWYRNSTTESWSHVTMTHIPVNGGNWTATISNQSSTTVKFYVEALDKAGNRIQSAAQEFNVAAPAFPLAWVLAVIAILAGATGGGAYYVRRKRKKGTTTTSLPSAAVPAV